MMGNFRPYDRILHECSPYPNKAEVLQKNDDISSADLNRILPTMVRHINFVGRFDLDFTRKPPFELRQVIG